MRRLLISLVAVGLWVGCSKKKEETAESVAKPAVEPVAEAAAPERGLTGKIKVKDGAGKELFAIDPRDDGAEVEDGSGERLARLKIDADKTKIKDVKGNVLGYVTGDLTNLKLKDADKKERLVFKAKGPERFELEDAAGKRIFEVKKRDYGYKVVDAEEKELFKVKDKSGKIVVRNAKDETLFSTKEAVSLEAMLFLGIPDLSLSERAALFAHVQTRGQP